MDYIKLFFLDVLLEFTLRLESYLKLKRNNMQKVTFCEIINSLFPI